MSPKEIAIDVANMASSAALASATHRNLNPAIREMPRVSSAIVAGVLGVSGVAGVATNIAYVLFVIAIVLFIVHFLTGRRTLTP